MKKLIYLAVVLMAALMQNCNNQPKDSVSMAKDANNKNDSVVNVDAIVVGLDEFKTPISVYSDADFAVEAADGGILEVQLGKMAETKASHQDVKDYGKLMVDDHTKINNELTILAKRKDILLPPTPSNKNINLIKKLNKKMGRDFDKNYINHMVSDHKKDINLFEEASKNTIDKDIKAFAVKTLPILRSHLAAAKIVKEKL